jgi:hypothetical protein
MEGRIEQGWWYNDFFWGLGFGEEGKERKGKERKGKERMFCFCSGIEWMTRDYCRESECQMFEQSFILVTKEIMKWSWAKLSRLPSMCHSVG